MPRKFSPPPRVSDSDIHHGTCVTHVPRCMPGSLTSGFLWSRWREKRFRHSRRMRSTQFCVSGKRPMNVWMNCYTEHGVARNTSLPWRVEWHQNILWMVKCIIGHIHRKSDPSVSCCIIYYVILNRCQTDQVTIFSMKCPPCVTTAMVSGNLHYHWCHTKRSVAPFTNMV